MMFSGNAQRRGGRVFQTLLVVASATLLWACGGGTTQEVTFLPTRLIAFGDENSLLTDNGRKYTINALDTADAIDCNSNPLWVQTVASSYSFVFPQCNPTNSLTPNATMRAAVGAKVDDVKSQIDAQVANGGFTNKDLVTVMAGANDVLALYGQFPTRTEDSLIADARAAGDRLAAQINRIVGLGPRVVVSTMPDMGLTPFALAQKAAYTDTNRAELITRLSAALNARMRVGIINDGRLIGLVLGDEAAQVMAVAPSAFGLTDAVAAACTTALPDCTTKTLVTDATSTTHLWADGTRMGVALHNRIGLLAQQRAINNPF